jgi:hypothetical protein
MIHLQKAMKPIFVDVVQGSFGGGTYPFLYCGAGFVEDSVLILGFSDGGAGALGPLASIDARFDGSSAREYGTSSALLLNVPSLFRLAISDMLSPEPVRLIDLRSVEDVVLALRRCSYSTCLSLFHPSFVNDPRRISASDGALATLLPVAAHMPEGTSASSTLIEARRTRPENEESRLGRLAAEACCAAVGLGGKVGDGGDSEV